MGQERMERLEGVVIRIRGAKLEGPVRERGEKV